MATVQNNNSVNDPYAAINGNRNSNASKKDSEMVQQEDRFLKLLTTQLRNQDPLNPMDNAQMTSQLAQMSTVSGIEKLNATLNTLVDSFGENQSMQAASMIGKSVLVPGTQLELNKGLAYGGVNLSENADKLKIEIKDSTGKVIQTQDLGAQKAGVINFAWDGKDDAGVKAPDGVYKISVQALRGGEKVKADPLQVGTVSALVRSGGGFLLDLGALGRVGFDTVQQIL